jgi:hypothetical protein
MRHDTAARVYQIAVQPSDDRRHPAQPSYVM